MDGDGGIVIGTDDIEWRDLAPGVGIKVLRLDRATEKWTVMLRAQPGAVLPPHQHLGNSELYILQGAGRHEETGEFRAGDYVLEAEGANHSPLFFEEEVILLMFAEGPSQFIDENGNPTFLMNVDMLTGFAEEAVRAAA